MAEPTATTSATSTDRLSELEQFRFDHGKYSSQLCADCHPFEPSTPSVDTYIGVNPECNSCHAPTGPSGDIPPLVFDMLEEPSHRVTHITSYPGYQVFDDSVFDGYAQTQTTVQTGGKGTGTEIIESISTGGQYELPLGTLSVGATGSFQTRLENEGSYRYDFTGDDFYNDGFRLQEARVGYGLEGDVILQANAGLFSPPTPYGYHTNLGASVYLKTDPVSSNYPDLSTYGFFGRSMDGDQNEWVSGAGLHVRQSEGENTVAGGADFFYSTDDKAPRLAPNLAASFASPDIGLSGSFLGKAYLDLIDPLTRLERIEMAGRVSFGDYADFTAGLFHEPGKNFYTPLFPNQPLQDNSTVNTSISVSPADPVRVEYSFGKGSYLFYDHHVELVLEIANHVTINPYYDDQISLLFGEELRAQSGGGTIAVDFKGFHTALTAMYREGDPLPLFTDATGSYTRLSLSGDYTINGVNISGYVIADITDGFQINSFQLRLNFPIGKKSGSDEDRRYMAEESLALISKKDPILGAIVNSAIYPRQKIPVGLNMSHQKMLAPGTMTCPTCHAAVEPDGQMSLPEAGLMPPESYEHTSVSPGIPCVACHHQTDEFEGHRVEMNYDRSEIVIPKSFMKFDHRIAGHVPEGDVADAVCITCHETIPETDVGTRNDLTPMGVCMTCHEGALNDYLVDKYNLDHECAVCHYTKENGKLITDTPYGLFFPQNREGYYADIFHGIAGSGTRETWYEDHPDKGMEHLPTCNLCHGEVGQSSCDSECHGTSANGVTRPDFHGLDWTSEHFLDWLQGNRSCPQCHTASQSDPMSFCRDCHDAKGQTFNRRHAANMFADCRENDSTTRHMEYAATPGGVQICTACHTPTHHDEITRQAVGCDSCHRAENLGTCD